MVISKVAFLATGEVRWFWWSSMVCAGTFKIARKLPQLLSLMATFPLCPLKALHCFPHNSVVFIPTSIFRDFVVFFQFLVEWVLLLTWLLSLSKAICHFENPGSFTNLYLLFLQNKMHRSQQTESFILL